MVSISLRNKSIFYEVLENRDSVVFCFHGSNNQWMEFRRFVANRSDLVLIEDVSDVEKTLSVRKIADISCSTRISVGIVFSGRDEEIENLYACIASFSRDSFVGEILVLSSGGFILDKNRIQDLPISIIEIPIVTNPRVLYSKKKNWVIKNALYDYVLIVHTRIRYIEGLNYINTRYWDIACGTVTYKGRGNLDMILTKRSLSGLRYVRSNMLLRLRGNKWNSYIDGGCFLVRKGRLAYLLDEGLAWGEQEDYDFCVTNSFKSREIVQFKGLKFETATNKILYKHPLVVWLVKFINLARWY